MKETLFKDVPIGEHFGVADYECYKYSKTHATFSGDNFQVDPTRVVTYPLEEPMVDEDDWDLGPACGLDPEVCESCQ